jgi:4a-hydroxytetrahydrobiopterin dehydratase
MTDPNVKPALAGRKCKPLAPGTPALQRNEISEMIGSLHGWTAADGEGSIRKTYAFEDHYEAMAFVNAVAWVSHREDHHPDLEVGYNKVTVRYSTHSVGGLSENDFICAAKLEALMAL